MSDHLVALNCRIPADLKEKLGALAEKRALTVTNVVVEALNTKLNDGGAAKKAAPPVSPEISEQARYLLLLSNSKYSESLWNKIRKEVENLWQMVKQ